MNETTQTKTPIQLMAELLAEMTARATEAERLLEASRAESDEWYRRWKEEHDKATDFRHKYTEEKELHALTITELEEAKDLIDKYRQQVAESEEALILKIIEKYGADPRPAPAHPQYAEVALLVNQEGESKHE